MQSQMQMKNYFIAAVLIYLFYSISSNADAQVTAPLKLPFKKAESANKNNPPKLPQVSLKSNPSVPIPAPGKCDKIIPKHIGFDALGVDLQMQLHKNKLELENVNISLNTGNSKYFEGIPIPCLMMIDVAVEKDRKEVFDLVTKECSKGNSDNRVIRLAQIIGNVFKKDKNNENSLKLFSFNPNDPHTYLKHERLAHLYKKDGTSHSLKDLSGAEKINNVIAKSGCTLRSQRGIGQSLDDYLDCSKANISGNRSIKEHLSEELKHDCALSYKTHAVGDLSLYSSSPELTKEKNIEQFNACVEKHSQLGEDERVKDLYFALTPRARRANAGDEFMTYDAACNIEAADKITKDLKIVEVLSDVVKNYTNNDISDCHDCQGVLILPDDKIDFLVEMGETNLNACFSDVSEYINNVQSKCDTTKTLSCSNFKSAKCILEIELDKNGKHLPINNYDALVEGYSREINRGLVSHLHQMFKAMEDPKQNRSLDPNAMPQFHKRLNSLRKCVEGKKDLDYLALAKPQGKAKFIAENLKRLRDVVKKMDVINENTTPEELKKMAKEKNGILAAMDKYGQETKKLSKLSEEEMVKKDTGSDDCSALSAILNHPNICEISEAGLKASGKVIADILDGFGEEKADLLSQYKEKINEEKAEAHDSSMKQMLRYLEIIKNEFTSKTKKNEMVELLVLHEAIEGQTKDLQLASCEETTSLTDNDFSKTIGKKGEKIKDTDVLVAGESVIASDEEDLRRQIEDLNNGMTSLQQQLSAALAQIQLNGGSTSGSAAYADAMLKGFSEYSRSLVDSNARAMEGQRQSFYTYTQSYDNLSANAMKTLYESNNSSLNALNYSHALYTQSLNMSRPSYYAPSGMSTAGWI